MVRIVASGYTIAGGPKESELLQPTPWTASDLFCGVHVSEDRRFPLTL